MDARDPGDQYFKVELSIVVARDTSAATIAAANAGG
jgi:hypothetical protein